MPDGKPADLQEVKAKVTRLRLSLDPEHDVFTVELTNKDAAWDETVGSEADLRILLRGISAGAVMAGGHFEMPEISRSAFKRLDVFDVSDEQLQKNAWQKFFARHDIACDIASITLPEVPSADHQLVIVPSGISPDQICELFKRGLNEFGIVSFIAPIHTTQAEKEVVLQFSDRVPKNDRTADSGPYAIWIPRHVWRPANGHLTRITAVENKMTVVEAFLYHLILLQEYGEEYLKVLNMEYHYCAGSRSSQGRTPALRWDLPDIKVVLDIR